MGPGGPSGAGAGAVACPLRGARAPNWWQVPGARRQAVWAGYVVSGGQAAAMGRSLGQAGLQCPQSAPGRPAWGTQAPCPKGAWCGGPGG